MKTISNNQLSQKELICYLRETIVKISDRVRNKMVLPYNTLSQIGKEEPLPREMIELSLADIHWLCHEFLSEIHVEVKSKTNGGSL